MSSQLTSFRNIDNALCVYYKRLGCSNYRNADGNGKFLQYIIDEELLDDDLPIEKELGATCDPNDCSYLWMNNETEFPIPHYAVINDDQKDAFIFYVLQYCWTHNSPPSEQYIKQKLVPQAGGCVVTNTLSSSIDSNIADQDVKKNELENDDENTESDINELDPLIAVVIEGTVCKWNADIVSFQDRKWADCNRIKMFLAKIGLNWTNMEAYNRETFMKLLKDHCGVPKALSVKIWKCIFKLKEPNANKVATSTELNARVGGSFVNAGHIGLGKQRSIGNEDKRDIIDILYDLQMIQKRIETLETDAIDDDVIFGIAFSCIKQITEENVKLKRILTLQRQFISEILFGTQEI